MKEWNPQMENVEDKLQQRLRPYQPDPEFVTTLKRRLTSEQVIELETYRKEKNFFLQTAAIIASIAFVLMLIKIIFRAR